MRRVGGRFTLENGIAVGGVATVYLGRDEVLDRPVAVKILHPGFEDSDLARRFEREGKTAASLSHPNIVQVYDAGKESDDERETSYIVMEYVSGGDLKDLMDEKGPMDEPELSRIGAEVAAGLAHAHERGVIHRDITPQTVLMGERGRPKLTDFGIARARDETRATTMTASYLGTTLYSSPEQLQNEDVTEKSDVYSLGATLYEAAVGAPVFDGTVFQVASRQVSERPVPPTERGAEMGGEFEETILSCLAKNPDDRPDATELRDKLERLSAEKESVSGPGSTQRRLVSVAGVSLVLVLLGAAAMLGATSMLGERQAGREESEGEAETPAASESANSSEPPDEPDGGSSGEGTESEGSDTLTEDAAAGTVATMYLSVVRGEYESSYEYLSEGYRREEFPTREEWEENFSDLRAITFTETPTARVSGEEAVVRGETASITNDGEAKSESGVWNLVAEGGEWKIDGIELRERSREAEGEV